MPSKLIYSVFVCSVFACFYVIGLIVFIASLPSEEQVFSVAKTDGLAIFTGGSKRIEAAIRLLEDGYNNPVLISGVNPKVSKIKLVGELPLAKQNLVTLDYASLSTAENVSTTKAWAKHNNLKSIGLITSFYHIPRSLLYWKRSGDANPISLYPVFPEYMPTSFLFREYHKYILTSLHII